MLLVRACLLQILPPVYVQCYFFVPHIIVSISLYRSSVCLSVVIVVFTSSRSTGTASCPFAGVQSGRPNPLGLPVFMKLA